MKTKGNAIEAALALDQMAMDELDFVRCLQRCAAGGRPPQRTGEKAERGRPRKRPDAKSRIVPMSIEPALLEQVDQYANRRH